jgi:hypothetical protein
MPAPEVTADLWSNVGATFTHIPKTNLLEDGLAHPYMHGVGIFMDVVRDEALADGKTPEQASELAVSAIRGILAYGEVLDLDSNIPLTQAAAPEKVPLQDWQPISTLAEYLEVSLGPHLVAFAAGAKPHEISAFSIGDSDPDPATAGRLRSLGQVFQIAIDLEIKSMPGAIHDAITLPHPDLEDRAAAELIRDDESDRVIEVAVAGRLFSRLGIY